MKILKSAALFITTSAFRFLLFFGILLLCFLFIFGNEDHVKSTFESSGVYKQFVDSIIKDNQANIANNSLPLDDPNVRKIINEAFPSELLQQQSEIVIDSFYAWLRGETPQPTFTTDFTVNRQQLADKLAAYAFDRLRAQPVCFAVPAELDPFTAGCQPPSTDLAAEQQKFSAAIAGEEGILPDAIFSTQDLPKDSKGQLITERYSFAPSVFQWLHKGVWLIGLLLVLFAVATISLHKSKRRGVQQVGFALIGSGFALLVTPLLLLYVLPRFSNSLEFSQTSSATQNLISSAGNQLTNDLYSQLINVTIQIIVLGVIILIIERFTRPPTGYLDIEKKAGVVSSHKRRPSTTKRILKAETTPIQSSEESKRRKPKRTKNKKYRKIPKKEI